MESHVRQLETFCGTVMLYDPDRIHGSGYVDTDLDTLPYMSLKNQVNNKYSEGFTCEVYLL